jgi:membrane-associated phospholipid phosphatase
VSAPATWSGPGVQRRARQVTDVLQPKHVLVAGLTGIGLAATGTLVGAAWGLFASVFAGVVPAGYIEFERRRGTWGDRHVVDRNKRRPIFLVILASIAFATAVMLTAGAPNAVLRSMIALWAMTVGLLTVNDAGQWKISVDAAVASAVVTMLTVVGPPWWALAYAGVALVCWTRVVLRFHTVTQTLAGTAMGLATALLWVV